MWYLTISILVPGKNDGSLRKNLGGRFTRTTLLCEDFRAGSHTPLTQLNNKDLDGWELVLRTNVFFFICFLWRIGVTLNVECFKERKV